MNSIESIKSQALEQIYNDPSRSSSTNTSKEAQNPVQSQRRLPLGVYELFPVVSFLNPKELKILERVSTTFKETVTYHWANLCQMELDLPSEVGLNQFLPEEKTDLKLVLNSIFGKQFYKNYLGNIGAVPPIPIAISLKKWNAPDPCEPTQTIGSQYVWMYCPSYIEVDLKNLSLDKAKEFCLDKADDPNDPEAPRLILRDSPSGQETENTTLKVAVSINNIIELFGRLKKGNPSYCSVFDEVADQHGNKRISAGWACVRRDLIGVHLTPTEKQNLAREKGVEISELAIRILFNLLENTRAKQPDSYPDKDFACTSTLTINSVGVAEPSHCVSMGNNNLSIEDPFDDDIVGAAVQLK